MTSINYDHNLLLPTPDIDSKLISLGDLAVKLGGFVGESESVKNAVKNATIAYFDTNSDLKNDLKDVYSPLVSNLSESVNSAGKAVDTDVIGPLKSEVSRKIDELTKEIEQLENQNNPLYNSASSPSPSAESDKLHSKLDALRKVEELCGFLSNSNNQQNEPKNLLDNLCDGLETFLGFNKESKGYDGTGIVYSDLDRLCDGVMAFLLGVLGAVKDDEAVKTYDVDENNKLEKVLDTLTTNIGSGRAGLAESVGEVKAWLGKYNDEVSRKTTALTADLKTLITKLDAEFKNSIYQNTSLTEQLSTWTSTLEKIETYVKLTDEILVENLDRVLKDKFRGKVAIIRESVQVLKQSAKDEVFVWQAGEVDKHLEEQRCKVKNEISRMSQHLQQTLLDQRESVIDELEMKIKEIRESFNTEEQAVYEKSNTTFPVLEQTLTDSVEKVFTEMHTLYETKNKQLADITDAFENVKAAVDTFLGEKGNDFDKTFTHGISKHFKGIKEAVSVLNKSDMFAGAYDNKSRLQLDMERIKSTISEYVAEAREQVQSLEDTVKATASEAYRTLHPAIGEVRKLKNVADGVRVELGTAAEQLVDSLKAIVENIKKKFSAVPSIRTSFESDLHQWLQEQASATFVSSLTSNAKSHATKVDQRYAGAINSALTRVDAALATLNAFPVNKKALEDAIDALEADAEKIAAINAHHSEVRVAIQTVLKKIYELEKTPEFVDKKKREAENLLCFLKGEIMQLQTQIHVIFPMIRVAEQAGNQSIDSLDKAVKAAHHRVKVAAEQLKHDLENTFTQAFSTSKAVVEDLRTQMIAKVERMSYDAMDAVEVVKEGLMQTSDDTFHVLTAQINKGSADSHRADLKSFKALVEIQQSDIQVMVGKDANTGVKGLLKWMAGNLNTYGIKSDREKKLEMLKNLPKADSKNFTTLSSNLQAYIDAVLEYIDRQIIDSTKTVTKPPPKPVTNPLPTDQTTDPANTLTKIKDDVDELLTHLSDSNKSKKYNYDHKFTSLLSLLSTSLHSLSPSAFANPRHPEILDAVKKGMEGFVEELGRVYVNGYDGGETINWNNTQSNDGDYCARIALTVFTILDRDIFDLKHFCLGRWKSKNIRLYDNINHEKQHENALGSWFKNCGYKVSDDERTHNGELDREKTGEKISALCSNNITGLQGGAKQFVERYFSTANGIQLDKLLNVLYTMVDKYYRASHLRHIPRAKLPTTTYQMLHWFVGLQWNPMYDKLTSYLRNWFAEFLKEHDLQPGELQVSVPARRSPSMVRSLTAGEMEQVFSNVIVRANKTLIALLGHGQEKGRYACDFNTNPDDLSYPSDAGKCFELLIEMCFRLNHQARFLYKQCQNYATQGGWRDCWYGKGIAGSGWNCNELQSPDQTCNQTAIQTRNQTPNQTPNQNGNQHLICGVKSPLQSYLEDGLPGFLPHHFSKSNCQITCDLPNHRGIPCKTPMGFRDIGIAASITGRGQDIKDVLEDFCGTRRESMNLLCAYFLCLLRRPPTTLCDMFSFYYNFLDHWDKEGKEHKKIAFDQAVNSAYFGAEYTQLDVTKVLASKEHKDNNHPKGDLFGILYCDPEATSYPPCGRYVQSISDDIRLLYTKKHAGVYLSWIVYMTETFYDLLKKLYDDCCKKCGNGGSKCHTKCCIKSCNVKYAGDDGKAIAPSKDTEHDKKCSSIVKCQDTHPTLYTYGFTFGSPYKLSGATNYEKQKRTCKDLCEALKIILGKDSALIELRHQIDNFLWAIREYFSYTALALWSASFLYLLYVYIGRLDTLHIRSHLRIPSSHKITAQSLLAAARVGRLSKIGYLQP